MNNSFSANPFLEMASQKKEDDPCPDDTHHPLNHNNSAKLYRNDTSQRSPVRSDFHKFYDLVYKNGVYGVRMGKNERKRGVFCAFSSLLMGLMTNRCTPPYV